jgi:DNA-binding transcriptional ArsR family regulator
MVQRSNIAKGKAAASHEQELDELFGALSDRVRRDVIAQLATGPMAITDLAGSAGMTLTGMAKHVRVLEEVGLVATEKVGRTRYCRIGTEPLDQAMAWIDRYQNLWQRRLDGLEAFFKPTVQSHDESHDQSHDESRDKTHDETDDKTHDEGDQ